MRFSCLAAALLFCATPLWTLAADVQEEDSVQEPDAQGDTPSPDSDTPAQGSYMPELAAPPAATATQPAPAPVTAPPAAPVTSPVGPQTPPAVASEPKPPAAGDTNFDTVMLQGLNKVTARPQELEVPLGSVIRYGTIEIIAHKCWKSAPEERPENAALLEVSEIKQGEAPQRIFSGWMFSSSPALSSLEHPFYDLNVISCKNSNAKP